MEPTVETIKSIRAKTNMGIPEIKTAIKLCDNESMAIEYLKLKYIAVARYKIVNGKKVHWEEQDYIEAARKNIKNERY